MGQRTLSTMPPVVRGPAPVSLRATLGIADGGPDAVTAFKWRYRKMAPQNAVTKRNSAQRLYRAANRYAASRYKESPPVQRHSQSRCRARR